MQRILVMDHVSSDYVHDDDKVQIEHLLTHKRYELLVKDANGQTKGSVAVLVPISSIERMTVEGDYCILLLTECEDATVAAQRKERVTQSVQRHAAAKKSRPRRKRQP